MTHKVATTIKNRSVADFYQDVRARTVEIVAPLEVEDYVVQTAEFMSPPRWHIGHTSWFFETVLQKYLPGYQTYSDQFLFYFNSYYEGFGARIERPKRGTRSRPTVRETLSYRKHIDEEMLRFIDSFADRDEAETILVIVRLGLEHEMQHQELLVYDIKHLLCDQFDAPIKKPPLSIQPVAGMPELEGELFELGCGRADRGSSLPRGPQTGSPAGVGAVREGAISKSGDKSPHSTNYDFAFDNEKPQHKVFLEDFLIDRAPVSNGDYVEFMNAGGYQDFRWWHSAGWEGVRQEQWQTPLYWERRECAWVIRDFSGFHRGADKVHEPVG